jgi:hypothetical protein
MRITNRQAYQPHPVPSHAYYPPEDPLEPDITQAPEIVYDDEEEYDERIFKCKHCGTIVLESDLDEHECE